jgi:hypothetical protein
MKRLGMWQRISTLEPRPAKDLSKDWPKLSGKPADHPFGPYTDTFSEAQHKYGPWGPIAAAKEEIIVGQITIPIGRVSVFG